MIGQERIVEKLRSWSRNHSLIWLGILCRYPLYFDFLSNFGVCGFKILCYCKLNLMFFLCCVLLFTDKKNNYRNNCLGGEGRMMIWVWELRWLILMCFATLWFSISGSKCTVSYSSALQSGHVRIFWGNGVFACV